VTPEEERVRRALRQVRDPGPVPDDVAARLEAALAGLRAGSDDPDADADAEVGPPARHRPGHRRPEPVASRQRRARLLLAAAALATVAVGGGLVVQTVQDGLTGSEEDATAGAASSAREEAPDLPSPEAAGPGGEAALAAGPVRLRSGRLGQDVERALRALPAAADRGVGATADLLRTGCVVPPPSDDVLLVPARLDGVPGTLRVPVVPASARGVNRVVTVEVLSCDDPARVRDVARVVVPRPTG
jgi:hypothetical protein